MKTLTIDECFYQIRNGANIKQGVEEGGYPITRIETIANGRFNRERMGYAGIIDLGKYESYLLEDGDLLMSHINSIQYLGRTVLYKRQGDEKIIHGMNLLGLKADKKLILPEYAKYYFSSSPFRKQISKITKKSVNQASFAVTDLKKVTLELPALFEQECIANTLNKISKVIYKYQQQLQKLDELIKSRFVEMFGNPDINEKKWNVYKMEQLCEVGSSKRIYQNDQSLTGIPFLRISDLVNRMDTGSKDCDLFIPEELFEKLKKQGLVPERGDILLTARGTLGRCYIIQDDDEFYFQDGMITWLSKFDEKITPLYISYLFEMPEFRKQIDSLQAGSTVAYLSISMTKELNVMVPPLELQNQFAAFVAQTDKSKFEIQKSLEKTQLLFDSLMQEYFG